MMIELGTYSTYGTYSTMMIELGTYSTYGTYSTSLLDYSFTGMTLTNFGR